MPGEVAGRGDNIALCPLHGLPPGGRS